MSLKCCARTAFTIRTRLRPCRSMPPPVQVSRSGLLGWLQQIGVAVSKGLSLELAGGPSSRRAIFLGRPCT